METGNNKSSQDEPREDLPESPQQPEETPKESEQKPDVPDEDIDIELAESDDTGKSVPGKKPVRIRLDASVRQQMIMHASQDTSNERGGILLGTVEEGDEEIVYIEAMIPARYTDSSSASLKFTHETWSDVYQVKDRLYPGKKIVGWYHTHPGMGVFLSQFDIHIHENFFNLNWQVAYVLDPVSRTEGFFRWEEGKIQKTIQYEFIGAVPYVGPSRAHAAPVKSSPGVISSGLGFVAIFVLIFMVAFLIWNQITMTSQLNDATAQINNANHALVDIQDEISAIQTEIEEQKEILNQLRETTESMQYDALSLRFNIFELFDIIIQPSDGVKPFMGLLGLLRDIDYSSLTNWRTHEMEEELQQDMDSEDIEESETGVDSE